MNPATITKRPPKKPWGVLAAMTYLAVSLALGWIAAESFVSAALVDDKYVTVPQTESGRLVGVLRSMVWCTWAAGTLVFLLGIIWVALTRKWIVICSLLLVQATSAGIVYYFAAWMIEILEG